MKILEIGFDPWLKRAFPETVDYIDTRLRWDNTRTYRASAKTKTEEALFLVKQLRTSATLAHRQRYDAMVVRALGSENAGKSRVRLAFMKFLGVGLRLVVTYASRGLRPALAILDLTDHRTIHPRDLPLLQRCDIYFKRELADNKWGSFETILPPGRCLGATTFCSNYRQLFEKIRPISLGIEDRLNTSIDFSGKRYDIFYAGTDYYGIPARERVDTVVAELKRSGFKVFAPIERISQEDFQSAIEKSWLSISPGGVGWDCYRHYEVALFGSCPVLNYPSNLGYKPFVHGESAFYFRLEDLCRLLQSLLSNKDRLATVTMNAQQHVRRWHTFPRLAEYICQELELVLAKRRSTK